MEEKATLGSSYSQIIGPEDYNRLMTEEHLYIHGADRYILKEIQKKASPFGEVVELGCGPARVLSFTQEIPSIKLTGVDLDLDFINYSRNILENKSVQLVRESAATYQHGKPVDIFYSQGFHHHIAKGEPRTHYLRNIYGQLKKGGYYIVGDEFVPDYHSEEERERRIVIWYSHIISHALRHGFNYLAQEEAKTLLDDLYEGRLTTNIKNDQQISLTLSSVQEIDEQARKNNLVEAENLASKFLNALEKSCNLLPNNDTSMDLSRGDYKICDEAFRKEVEPVGFSIETVKSFGPMETIGGMVVYILRKD